MQFALTPYESSLVYHKRWLWGHPAIFSLGSCSFCSPNILIHCYFIQWWYSTVLPELAAGFPETAEQRQGHITCHNFPAGLCHNTSHEPLPLVILSSNERCTCVLCLDNWTEPPMQWPLCCCAQTTCSPTYTDTTGPVWHLPWHWPSCISALSFHTLHLNICVIPQWHKANIYTG